MTLEDAIIHAEDAATSAIGCECREEHRQLADWLTILKKAKCEYDEAYRVITCPTPDVTTYDKVRAKTVLEVFRDSLGEME